MIREFQKLRCVVAALALIAPVAARAAPVAPVKNARATAVITGAAALRKLQDLDFAFVTVTTAGTAVVDPDTDVMTTTGGVLGVGGMPYAALFEAVSPIKNVVHIRVPKQSATLTRVGGTETMVVDNFTISGGANRNVVAKQAFTFKVGGRLRVAAGQAEGTYTGTFDVDIQYP
jgi:hypothetical protein